MTNQIQLDTALSSIALAAAEWVAPYLRRVARTAPTTTAKMSVHDPVTVHDQHVEKQLRNFLGCAIPLSRVLGEEYGEEVLTPSEKERNTLTETLTENHLSIPFELCSHLGGRVRWIVDPIDGTANFAAGMTYFGTSIGVELDGEMVAGAVTIPWTHEAFVADSTDFYHINSSGKRVALNADGPSEENSALIATYYPNLATYDSDPLLAAEHDRKLFDNYFVLRKPGAAALDLAQVAAGWVGVSMGISFGPWDVAAGIHMVRVAGGKVLNLPMGTDLPDGMRPGVVAAGKNLHPTTAETMLRQVNDTFPSS